MSTQFRTARQVCSLACALFLGAAAWVVPAVAQDDPAASPAEAAAPAAEAAPTTASKVIMRVNGEDVHEAELDTMVTRMMMQNMQQMASSGQKMDQADFGKMRESFKSRARENMVKQKLIKQQIEKSPDLVGQEKIDAELAKLTEQLKADGRDIQQFLKENNLTEVEIRKDIKDRLTITELVVKSEGSVEPTEDQIKEIFEANKERLNQGEQVKASHILIGYPGDPRDPNRKPPTDEEKAALRQKAQEALNRVKGGEDFAAVAREMSSCPSKAQGGDLGFFGKNQMVPEFEKVAFGMKPGELSDVVETQFGFHVIKVTDVKAPTTVSLESEHDKIKAFLAEKGVMEKLDAYAAKLKADAKIEDLEPLAAAEPAADKPAEKSADKPADDEAAK